MGSTTDVDSVSEVELVDCEVTAVEIGIMVELVVEEGDTVVDRIVVKATTVDVGSEIEEVIDGNGVSQILYSQLAVYYEPAWINIHLQTVSTTETNNDTNFSDILL